MEKRRTAQSLFWVFWTALFAGLLVACSPPGLTRPVPTITRQPQTPTSPPVSALETPRLPAQQVSPSPQSTLPPTENLPEFFVSPNGSPGGDGSREYPWDLSKALEPASAIQPGDTIWMMGGVYGSGGDTLFRSKLSGTEGQPVILRALPGERVTIDGSLAVLGPWTTIWGLEITNSSPDRESAEEGSHPDDLLRKDGIDVYAPHTTLVNNLIHDTRQGVGFWSEAPDSEMYGNIIFNNGWSAPDRSHGHGIYTQNETGTKILRENVIFSNFSGYNIHAYSTDGFLNGFQIEKNVIFDGQLLVGSETQPASRIAISQNYLYNSQVQLGYQAQNNQDLVFEGNTVHLSPGRLLEIKWWQSVLFSGNRIWGNGISWLFPAVRGSYHIDSNQYLGVTSPTFGIDGADLSWRDWQAQGGFDLNSSIDWGYPSGVEVIVLPNQYEPGRATIVVYNWDRQESVTLEAVSLGLEAGESYTLASVRDYDGKVLHAISDGGRLTIPMTGWTAASPVGWGQLLNPDTLPEFGVFVLTSP